MVHRQNMAWRQILRPIHTSQMLERLVSACEPKFWYLHGSWFWVVLVPHLSGAGQSRLPWGVLPAAFGVTIPDDPVSAGALSTDGTGVREVVFSTPAMGLSFSSCSMLGLMGSRQFHAESSCALPHPWSIPHKLAHWDRATFPQHIPYSPSILNFVMTFEGSYTD